MAQGLFYKDGVYFTSPQTQVITVSEEEYNANKEHYDSLPSIVIVEDGKVADASDIKYGNGSVADALRDVKESLSDYVLIHTFSATASSVSANGTSTVQCSSYTIPTGYKYLAMIGGSTNSTSCVFVAIGTAGQSGKTYSPSLIIRNLTSSKVNNVTARIELIMIRV